MTLSGAGTELDLTAAAGLRTLFLETAAADMTVTNFAGSAVTLYADSTGGVASTLLTLDGVGQAALTVTLENYDGDTASDDLTVTGVQSLTVAGRSTSQFTGNAAQDNAIDILTAASVDTIRITTSGSTAANAEALAINTVTATLARDITVSVGNFDDFDLGAINATGDLVENLTVTLGTDAILDADAINLDASVVTVATITLGAGSIMNENGNGTIAAAQSVDLSASTITALTVTLNAGAEANLDLSGIAVTAGTLSVDSSANLTLDDSLGRTGAASSFVFTGRGDVDSTDGTTIGNAFTLVGSSVSFNSSGLTTDDDALTITGTDGADSITTGLGADTITGGVGADTINGGAGADLITGGAGIDVLTGGVGADDYRITGITDGNDTINFSITDGDQILFDVDDVAADGTSDLFDLGAAIFADTDPTNTAGTIVVLDADDYNEGAGGALNFADNHVNVVTTTGYASVVAALAANGGADGEAGVLVFFNTTTSKVEMYYTADADSATATDHTLIGTLNGLTLANVADLSNVHFGVFSLG